MEVTPAGGNGPVEMGCWWMAACGHFPDRRTARWNDPGDSGSVVPASKIRAPARLPYAVGAVEPGWKHCEGPWRHCEAAGTLWESALGVAGEATRFAAVIRTVAKMPRTS